MQQATPMHILVVDDDTAIQHMLASLLEDEGFLVATAVNGQAALELLQNEQQVPCVILLDLMMPVMSGWQFRDRQRADERLATIPVIVLSAAERLNQECAELGVAACLPKPIDFDMLVDAVRLHCVEAEAQ